MTEYGHAKLVAVTAIGRISFTSFSRCPREESNLE